METDSPNQALARQVVWSFAENNKGALLARMYDGYRSNVMPPEAPPVQVLECKKAFFAGAQTILDLMFTVADPGPDVTTDEVAFMEALSDEIEAYHQNGVLQEHLKLLCSDG